MNGDDNLFKRNQWCKIRALKSIMVLIFTLHDQSVKVTRSRKNSKTYISNKKAQCFSIEPLCNKKLINDERVYSLLEYNYSHIYEKYFGNDILKLIRKDKFFYIIPTIHINVSEGIMFDISI